jgi:hypothetical protein
MPRHGTQNHCSCKQTLSTLLSRPVFLPVLRHPVGILKVLSHDLRPLLLLQPGKGERVGDVLAAGDAAPLVIFD